MGKDPEQVREEIENTRDSMGQTVEAIGYKADVKTRAKEALQGVREAVSESTSELRESVVGSARDVKESAVSSVRERSPNTQPLQRRAGRMSSAAQGNPLALAGGAVAAGFMLGLVFPSSRTEDERLGPISDDVKQKAKETGQEAVERGKQVTQEAKQTATEGLKTVGDEVVGRAQQEVDRQAGEMQGSGESEQHGAHKEG